MSGIRDMMMQIGSLDWANDVRGNRKRATERDERKESYQSMKAVQFTGDTYTVTYNEV